MAFLMASMASFARQHAADRKEARLHDRVDAAAHPGFASDLVPLDHIKPETLFDDCFLHSCAADGSTLRSGPNGAFSRNVPPGSAAAKNVHALEKLELVTGHEIGSGDQIRRANRTRAETQVGYGDRARFFRVVNEIALRVVVRVLSDDLDGILVGAHGAVRAEAVEKRPHGSGIFGGKACVIGEAGMRDVVLNADREMVFWRGALHFVEDSLRHRGRKFFRGKPVTSADDAGKALRAALAEIRTTR